MFVPMGPTDLTAFLTLGSVILNLYVIISVPLKI